MYTNKIKNVGDVNFYEYFDSEAFTFKYKKFSEIIPEDSIVLDIGAHVGGFSIVFGSCVGKNGKVLAFEPNPKTYGVLVENSKNNPNFNIIPYNFACTPETKKYTFNYSDPTIYNNGMNGGYFDGLNQGETIKNFHSYEVEVDGVNVVDFLNKNHADLIDNIKFIKTDTEGLDKEVLKTLRPIIKKNKPVLMVEAFVSLTDEEIEDYYNVLKSFDYEIYDVSP
jgi:FkbM family methyltransferase